MNFIYSFFDIYEVYIAIISLIVLPLYYLYLMGEGLFSYLKRKNLSEILIDVVLILLGTYLITFIISYFVYILRASANFSFVGMNGLPLFLVSLVVGITFLTIQYYAKR